ncbi:MAG: hypothetical protein IJH34_12045 [Romboutsia sp.]|nr:hypothetical protein [Romboutsia sp.]
MVVNFNFLGTEVEILFGGHEKGRRIERDMSITEVLTFIELAQDKILDLKFNQKFAIVSTCKTKGLIATFKNNRGNLCIDIITVLNSYGCRDLYFYKDTPVICLNDCI